MVKAFKITLLFLLGCHAGFTQGVVREYSKQAVDSNHYYQLKNTFGKNKTLPVHFEQQALLALSHFPELTNIKIKFKVKRKLVPLATHPTVLSSFRKAAKRKYKITITTHKLEYWVMN